MERKLSFWIEIRQFAKSMDSVLMREIRHSINFGEKIFDPEQLEAKLLAKFNKVELRKIDDKPKKALVAHDSEEEEKVGELPLSQPLNSKRDAHDPLFLMENHLGNLSAICTPILGGNHNFTYN
jgi:hypothetical protein